MTKEKERETALVTGATSGIGKELSRLFAQNGFDLVMIARDRPRLEHIAMQLRDDFGISADTIPKDLSHPAAPEEILSELRSKSIHIDVLVNNAGFNEYGPFNETDMQRELQMIQVNMVSLTCLTKLLLPGMLRQNHGRVLNVGSTGSFAPGPLNAVYCATKAYVLSFSDALSEELRDTGVTVTTLCPGPTKTNFARRAEMEDAKIFQGSLMDARRVSEIGYQALMDGKTSVIAGTANKLLVFSLRFMPRNMVARISRGMMSRTGGTGNGND
jgi:short-subunit dehydrogenase